MLNILINAYAVSPSWGSEPGMGWNWISHLARFCNLFIITEGEWRNDIEKAIDAGMHGNTDKKVNPTKIDREQAIHMHFYYENVSSKVRKMCWNQGDWRFYKYYDRWQKRSLARAEKIIEEFKGTQNQIDLIHQLNMIGFREPGKLWKISELPYVWGPVGGYANIPVGYLRGEDIFLKIKEILKTIINVISIRYQPNVRKAMARADALIAAYKETYDVIRRIYGEHVSLINETGSFLDDTSAPHPSDKEVFQILWVGKYDVRKQLGIAIKSMSYLKHKPNIQLYVLGTGSPKDVKKYTSMIKSMGLEKTVHLKGVIPNVQTREWMHTADLLLFTSVHDATSTVVPEAISAGLPVLCHNTRGFGDIVDNEIGRKIELSSPESSAKEFARIIDGLESDRRIIRELSKGCTERQKSISWDANARKMIEQYKMAIERFNAKHGNND